VGLFAGLLLVRWMEKDDYAAYTLAASALAFLNISTDLGLSAAVLALGGQCHGDNDRLARLVRSALYYRRLLLAYCAPVMLSLLPWIFHHHGWTGYTPWLISLAVLASTWFHAGAAVYGAVLKLQYAILPLQIVDATANGIRLTSILLLGSGHITALAAVFINLLGSLWQYAGNHANVSRRLRGTRQAQPIEHAALWQFTRPLIASNLFYAMQGQIAIWLVTWVAPSVAIAEVGALGRLGQLVLFLNMFVTLLVQPYLARLKDQQLYRARVLQISLAETAGALAIATSGYLFPALWLHILGARYAGLGSEAALMITLAAIVFLGDCFYYSLIARCHTVRQWLRIPVTIAGIAIGALLSPPIGTRAAIIFQFYMLAPYTVLQGVLLVKYLRTCRVASERPAVLIQRGVLTS
jgi:hypothetical protein